MFHQKAAYEILTELFDPQSICQSELSLEIFGWYARFDIFAGIMGGHLTVLDRRWFQENLDHYQRCSKESPNIDLTLAVDKAHASMRLLGQDLALIFASHPTTGAEFQEFEANINIFTMRLQSWRAELDVYLQGPKNGPVLRPRDYDPSEDIVDPYAADVLYMGELWPFNFLLIDCCAIELIFKWQVSKIFPNRTPTENLENLALGVCQICASVEVCAEAPAGSFIATQAPISTAAVFFKKPDQISWIKRKFAVLERQGYVDDHLLIRSMTLSFAGCCIRVRFARKWHRFGKTLWSKRHGCLQTLAQPI
jgi:hypothetical protein